jgi:hypothetical protein
MIQAQIKGDSYHYVIEAITIPLFLNKYTYAAKIVKVTDPAKNDLTARALVNESYGATPGEAIDKIFVAVRAVLGDRS